MSLEAVYIINNTASNFFSLNKKRIFYVDNYPFLEFFKNSDFLFGSLYIVNNNASAGITLN